MKFTKYFMPLAAIALLASCSNDNLDAPAQEQIGGEGSSYASFTINLPTLANSKASLDGYDNGTANEYAVSSGKIYLFKATKPANGEASEANITFVKDAVLVSDLWKNNSNGDPVTSYSTTAVAEFKDLEAITAANDYYVLVILNAEDDFTAPTPGQAFSAWKKTILNSSSLTMKNSDGYFTMTNAPLLADGETAFGTDAAIATLVKIDATKISPSPVNVQSAGTIYVQRVLAKVKVGKYSEGDSGSFSAFQTVDNPNNTFIVKNTQNEDQDNDEVTLIGWALDRTNTKTYPVQNVESWGDWVNTTEVKSHFYATTTPKRIFWSVDPNYDAADASYTSSNEFNVFVENTTNPNWTALENPDYCFENTMSHQYMTEGQTTRVIFKATYTLAGKDAPQSFMTYGNLKIALTDDQLADGVTSGSTTFGDLIKEGDAQTALQNQYGFEGDTPVTFYKDGVMYYTKFIQHFDDIETNWEAYKSSKWPDGTTYAYSLDQLGRWGVVRNNVYQMGVRSFYGVGEPTIPDPTPGDPDDPKDDKMYMDVDIKILAWAQRTNILDF